MGAGSKPKISILTAGDINGRRLAKLLSDAGADYSLFVVGYSYPKRFRIRFLQRYLRAYLGQFELIRKLRHRNLEPYPVVAVHAGMNNSSKLISLLNRENIDYLALMGGGIVSEQVLRSISKGVLNVHPGLLPYVRGIDVVGHALLQGYPVGVTAHFVDPGIDTGDLICRYLVPAFSSDSLSDIEERADRLSVLVMYKLLAEITAGGLLDRLKQGGKFALCRSMTEEERSTVVAKVSDGEHVLRYKNALNEGNIPCGSILLDQAIGDIV